MLAYTCALSSERCPAVDSSFLKRKLYPLRLKNPHFEHPQPRIQIIAILVACPPPLSEGSHQLWGSWNGDSECHARYSLDLAKAHIAQTETQFADAEYDLNQTTAIAPARWICSRIAVIRIPRTIEATNEKALPDELTERG